MLGEPVGLGAGDVAGAVLEAEEVAGRLGVRRGRGRLAEAQLGPAHRDLAEADPRQVPDGVHGDLRVVRARLDAEVAAAAGRIQVVARELGQLHQGPGLLVLQPEAPVEQRGAEADGEGEPGGLEAEGLAGVVRRGLREAAVGAVADLGAGRHALGRPGPVLEELDQLGAVGRRHVEGREVQPVLDGGGDTGLVRAVEGNGRSAVGDRYGGVPVPGQQGGAAARRDGTEREPGTARGDDRTAGGRGGPCRRHRLPGLLGVLGHVRVSRLCPLATW